jgi:hypothetical protein
VDLVCQSNGAHVCRYLAKFGDASLEAAEAGGTGPPPELTIRKLVLLGSSNGGSIRILRELHKGRNYLPVIGRRFLPETLFSCPSMFLDLPVYRDDCFVDETGRTLEVDLFDPAAWKTYGWSIFSPSTSRRLEREPRPDLFFDTPTRLAYLGRVLRRGRRTLDLLHEDGPTAARRIYSIQSRDRDDTPDRAMLRRRGEEWDLFFPDDPEISRNPTLLRHTTAAGDGHATVESQRWLSTQERQRSAPTLYSRGGHLEMVYDDRTLELLLQALAEPLTAPSSPPRE